MFEDTVAKRIVLPLEKLGLYVATYLSPTDVPLTRWYRNQLRKRKDAFLTVKGKSQLQ